MRITGSAPGRGRVLRAPLFLLLSSALLVSAAEDPPPSITLDLSELPSGGLNKYTTKRNARKAMASIEKQLDGWRSDLVVAAKARMSVVQKGLRIKKKA